MLTFHIPREELSPNTASQDKETEVSDAAVNPGDVDVGTVDDKVFSCIVRCTFH